MNKSWYDKAWEDYLYWQAQDKKTLKRINQLIKDTERNPLKDTGTVLLSCTSCQSVLF